MSQRLKAIIRKIVSRRYALLSILMFVVFWEFVAFVWEGYGKPVILLPGPSSVISQIISSSFYYKQLGYTLRGIMVGLLLAFVLGAGLGYLSAQSKRLRDFLSPLLVFSQTTPKIILAPLLYTVLQAGKIVNEPSFLIELFVVCLISYFPIYSAVNRSILEIREEKLSLFKLLNATRLQLFLKLQLPSMIPQLLDALKVSFFYAVIGQVVSEMLRCKNGLGFIIGKAEIISDNLTIFATIGVISTVGFIIWNVFSLVRNKLEPYYGNSESE